MTEIRWVGITGYAGVGKDTVANIMAELYNFQRYGLADALKEDLYELNPYVVDNLGYTIRLAALVDEYGWDHAKQHVEVRRLLQNFGVAQRKHNENYWLERLDDRIWADYPNGYDLENNWVLPPIVVPDVRFENEARQIHDYVTGIVIRVERPGFGPLNGHESENGIPEGLVDYTIINDGTREDLAGEVEEIMQYAEWVRSLERVS